jgi:hypothetical protein
MESAKIIARMKLYYGKRKVCEALEIELNYYNINIDGGLNIK